MADEPEILPSLEFMWLAESKRFLLAAEVLRSSDEYARTRLLITPTLHVLAHGIELFLKATLIRNGASEVEARNFGHGICRLWDDSRNAETRRDIFAAADEEWEDAKTNPKWQDDFDAFGSAPLEEYLKRLSQLHSKDTDYALRYVGGRTSDTTGPKPHLLTATFHRIADRYLHELAKAAQ